jgi:hypothetical protein
MQLTRQPTSVRHAVFVHLSACVSTLDAEQREHFLRFFAQKEYHVLEGLVFADEQGRLSEFSFESWFRELVSSGNGVYIGSGMHLQTMIKTNKLSPCHQIPLQEDFGFYGYKGKTTLIKLISAPEPSSAQA